jgi:hypothetical protein
MTKQLLFIFAVLIPLQTTASQQDASLEELLRLERERHKQSQREREKEKAKGGPSSWESRIVADEGRNISIAFTSREDAAVVCTTRRGLSTVCAYTCFHPRADDQDGSYTRSTRRTIPECIAPGNLAFDANDRPAIACAGKYVCFDGALWRHKTIDPGKGPFSHHCLDFDAEGNPAVAYFDEGQMVLKFARREGSAWKVEPVEPVFVWKLSFEFDPQGRPGIAYVTVIDSIRFPVVKFACFNGSNWRTQLVRQRVFHNVHLDYDDRGSPVIGFHARNERGFSEGLACARFDGSSWEFDSPLLAAMTHAEMWSFALAPGNVPAFAYFDHDQNKGTFKYSRFDGTSWATEVVHRYDRRRTHPSAIAFDSAGNPFLATIAKYSRTGFELRLSFRFSRKP